MAVDLVGSSSTAPARTLLSRLIDHLRPALESLGDYDMARTELARVVAQGNGAMRQRRTWCTSGNVKDVISEIATATTDFNQD